MAVVFVPLTCTGIMVLGWTIRVEEQGRGWRPSDRCLCASPLQPGVKTPVGSVPPVKTTRQNAPVSPPAWCQTTVARQVNPLFHHHRRGVGPYKTIVLPQGSRESAPLRGRHKRLRVDLQPLASHHIVSRQSRPHLRADPRVVRVHPGHLLRTEHFSED